MLIPVYGFVSGDTLGVLVLVQDRDSIATLSATLAQATAMRVAPFEVMRLRQDGVLLNPELTLAEARVAPLSRVDLVAEPGA
jgi:hypothetical protein